MILRETMLCASVELRVIVTVGESRSLLWRSWHVKFLLSIHKQCIFNVLLLLCPPPLPSPPLLFRHLYIVRLSLNLLCSPSWSQTCKPGLASLMLGLQACTTTSSIIFLIYSQSFLFWKIKDWKTEKRIIFFLPCAAWYKKTLSQNNKNQRRI